MVPPTREVTVSLLFQMFSIRKWLRPESKEESSMLGNIVSHLSMDSRCLSWWTRKTGAGWVLKISKGKVTTSSINKISLLKKRKPELLKEDERLLTSSEVSVSTGDSGQFKCENLIVWDYSLSWQMNVYEAQQPTCSCDSSWPTRVSKSS